MAFAADAPRDIDFDKRPAYLDDNVIVLTFDDGPDRSTRPRCWTFSRPERQGDLLHQHRQLRRSGRRRALNVMSAWSTRPRLTCAACTAGAWGRWTRRWKPGIAGVERDGRSISARQVRADLVAHPLASPRGRRRKAPCRAQQGVGCGLQHAVHIGWAVDTLDSSCRGG